MQREKQAYGPPETGLAAVMRKAQTMPTGSGVDLRDLVAPLYDPALGLDRSVCLRDVIDALAEWEDDYHRGVACEMPSDFVRRALRNPRGNPPLRPGS